MHRKDKGVGCISPMLHQCTSNKLRTTRSSYKSSAMAQRKSDLNWFNSSFSSQQFCFCFAFILHVSLKKCKVLHEIQSQYHFGSKSAVGPNLATVLLSQRNNSVRYWDVQPKYSTGQGCRAARHRPSNCVCDSRSEPPALLGKGYFFLGLSGMFSVQGRTRYWCTEHPKKNKKKTGKGEMRVESLRAERTFSIKSVLWHNNAKQHFLFQFI